MIIHLKNKKQAFMRLLEAEDHRPLTDYFVGLSTETRKKFGPHPFDQETAEHICKNLEKDEMRRYVAVDDTGAIVGYMLILPGMIDEDRSRLLARNIYFDQSIICTYAPSVADDWQNSGLGSSMYDFIERDLLKNNPWKIIILWYGVQATNEQAVHFYKKKGFQIIGNFWHNEQDNFDMIKHIR